MQRVESLHQATHVPNLPIPSILTCAGGGKAAADQASQKSASAAKSWSTMGMMDLEVVLSHTLSPTLSIAILSFLKTIFF